MKKAVFVVFLVISAAFSYEYSLSNYGYAFKKWDNGSKAYYKLTLKKNVCFQPSTTLTKKEDPLCTYRGSLDYTGGSFGAEWGCFDCYEIDTYNKLGICKNSGGYNTDTGSCQTCPSGSYWNADTNSCTENCFDVTDREQRFQCAAKLGGLGNLKSFNCSGLVCNGSECSGLTSECVLVGENGTITTEDLFNAAVEKYGDKEKALVLMNDFINTVLGYDPETQSLDFSNAKSDTDLNKVLPDNPTTGGGSSSGSSSGSSGSNIDGDNPDPFAPKPTRPGVVGGDDSGTGDGTGGSGTGEGGQSGGSTGSDSNSTHSGGGSGSGNNEHADGNGTESGILDELKAFHDENINSAPANGDDIMNIDSKNHQLNGEYNKKIDDGFRDSIADLNVKVETAQNDIKEAISKIQNGFFQFNKEAVTACPVVKSFNVAGREIKIEYDFCLYLNKLYAIFYALSFASVCFMGYKYILSRVFSFGGAE